MISEAIVAGTPVIASEIPGNIGLLGEDYPGYFKVGETRALASLMFRAEHDPEYLARLQAGIRTRQHLFFPERERQSWKDLLRELS